MSVISEYLNEFIEHNSVIKTAQKELDENDISDRLWCKPLLLMVEYHITDDTMLSDVQLGRNVQLEHVYPTHPKKNEWTHITKEISAQYLNSAGNITLIGGSKNNEASNKSFGEKITAYQGERGGGTTPFEITRKIIKDYDDGTYQEEWNEAAMCDRKKWFIQEVYKILEIPVSGNE